MALAQGPGQFPGAPPALLEPPPLPDDLASFVPPERFDAAVALGKALFWDVQLGGDGMTACATCHYRAGINQRPTNTLHPGADGVFAVTQTGGGGVNYELRSGDYPFHRFLNRLTGIGDVVSSVDDVRGATGVVRRTFDAILPGSAVDGGLPDPDTLFTAAGLNLRQSTGRDAPTVIGANYITRLFWDGRANHFFNGRNIWGEMDPDQTVLRWDAEGGVLAEVPVLLNNAAAASQAVGPPLSGVEMSWAGRDFFDLGVKMVPLRPLALQGVDPTDGVLGPMVDVSGIGLAAGTTYADMIAAAFEPEWWASPELWTEPGTGRVFTHIEANFSLFFGLAILCYESTLVPDQTRYDAFMKGDQLALSPLEKIGLDYFLDEARCINCHTGTLFAGAVSRRQLRPPGSGTEFEGEGPIELMAMANLGPHGSVRFATDPGAGELPLIGIPWGRTLRILPPGTAFPDTIVASATLPPRPTFTTPCPPATDLSVPLEPGAMLSDAQTRFLGEIRVTSDGACGHALEISMSWENTGPSFGPYRLFVGAVQVGVLSVVSGGATAFYDGGFYNIGVRPTSEDVGVGGAGIDGRPLSFARRSQLGEDLSAYSAQMFAVGATSRTAVDGAFKAPTLRNIELTGPYMHNGSMKSLEEVIDFYARGVDFRRQNVANLDPDVSGISGISEQERAGMVAFLKALTDERVRIEAAPFDHPELPLPTGHTLVDDGTGAALDVVEILPATGAAGAAPFEPFDRKLEASITIWEGPGVEAMEGGPVPAAREGSLLAPNQFAIMLDRRPTADVTIDLGFDPAQVSVAYALMLDQAFFPLLATPSLTFTPADWRQTRVVTVTAKSDGLVEGPHVVPIATLPAVSADPAFQGLDAADVAVAVMDNDDCLLLSIEAESGTVTAPAALGFAPKASGGLFVWAPFGTPTVTSPDTFVGGTVSIPFDVTAAQAAAGEVVIWGLTFAPNGSRDSWWYRIDGGTWTKWNVYNGLLGTGSWDRVNANGAAASFALGAGSHVLELKISEAATILDQLILTNAPGFQPAGAPVDPSDT